MRHQKAGLKLNRTSSHRNAMFRNMVTSLFKYDRIQTTDAKAKELKRWADHLITLAKRGDLHARRQALSIIREKNVVHKLFEEAAARYGDVSGGYAKTVKLGRRHGDAALMTMVELISFEKSKRPKRKSKKKEPGEITKPADEMEAAVPVQPEPESVTESAAQADEASDSTPSSEIEPPDRKIETADSQEEPETEKDTKKDTSSDSEADDAPKDTQKTD